LNLEATALGLVETPTTDILAPFIVPIQFHERQTVPHTAMETNVVTSSRNSSIPTTVATIGESSPNLPSLGSSHHGLGRNYVAQWTEPIYGSGHNPLHT
jgi:hypothetical protein